MLWLVLMVLGAILVLQVDSQPKCSVGSFPPVLPLVSSQSLPIDLNEYFLGSNLTFHLSSQDASLSLSSKYSI